MLFLIIVLATTSIGWGPIPGWWKWSYTDLVPSQSGDGAPTMSLRPTWLGGAGIHLGDHPFGLDNELGKDMFAMTMRGVQTRLAVIFVLGVLATTIGVVIGALSGYYGRWVDSALMRFTDIIIVIPLLAITAVAGFALGLEGMWPVALALGLFTWTGLARLVRAEFLALREREFVDAARVADAPDRRIIFKHILPNTVGTIVVSVTLLMGAGILTEAALGFLGFGIQAPRGLAGHARQRLRRARTRAGRGCSCGRACSSSSSCCACSSSVTACATPSIPARSGSRSARTSSVSSRARRGATTPGRPTPRSPAWSRRDVRPDDTMPAASSTTPARRVPRCQRTGARSSSRRGSSR